MAPTSESHALRTAALTVTFLLVAALLWATRDVLMLIGFAALLAYALDPIAAALQRVRIRGASVSRGFASGLVVLALFAVGIWAVAFTLPRFGRELAKFVEVAPESLTRFVERAQGWAMARGLPVALTGGESLDAAAIVRNAGSALLAGLGKLLGNFGQLVGLALIPILTFYLMAEREAVEASALRFVPDDLRARVRQVMRAIDLALRSYVRGQAVVCLTMGTLVGVVLGLLGFPLPVLLGTIVALAEVVPILGFWVALLAILLAGLGESTAIALGGGASYLAINQLVGLFVTPRVMGRYMKMHPFVVTASILAGGTLLGAGGAILAIPLAAALQSAIAEITRRPSPEGQA